MLVPVTRHLPDVHLLLEEVCELLLPLRAAIFFTTASALFVKPATCEASVSRRFAATEAKILAGQKVPEVVLPFEAVALPPSFVEVSLEAERSGRRLAPRAGRGAEDRPPLQLGAHGFGVAAVVAGAGAVRRLVPKELGDGGVATTGGKVGDTAGEN